MRDVRPGDPEFGGFWGIVDVELTNRCNAHCEFCPRDATPHLGLMSGPTFERTLERVVEFYDAIGSLAQTAPGISFCGLGDQLIHPQVASWVAAVRGAGLEVAVNTNGALLDAERGQRLLDADVTHVLVNGGETGEAYEEVYGLSFERVSENVRRFVEMADGRCEIWIVLVDHRRDPVHVRSVEAHWKALGVRKFFRLDLLNRAGSLHWDHMDFGEERHGAEAVTLLEGTPHAATQACRAPLQYPFVGYDGNYYLCSSDWEKQVSLGSVHERSILDVVRDKLDAVTTRDPICRTCNHDPQNRLRALLVARDAGEATDAEVDALVAELDEHALELERILAGLDPLTPAPAPGAPARRAPERRRIPVRIA
jgi:MoaA/NifB/PqqE/SkfB family radical SAM enzyme